MIHTLPNGTIHRARAEAVYPTLTPGSVTLVHSDGPYGMGKAAWDRVKDLAAWYRPHIAAWGEVCAASASVYLWNTAAGWAAIHPEMLGAGWEFASLIVWHKIGAHPSRLGAASSSMWPDVIEVAGHYRRGAAHHVNPQAAECVWAFDATNGMRRGERLFSDATVRRTGGGGRYYDCREPLHPCQKPLLFARRIIEASSRPGDLILEPFAGTARIAVACEDIAREDAAKARRYVCVEADEDGREYIAAVLADLRGERVGRVATGQMRMFGGGAA